MQRDSFLVRKNWAYYVTHERSVKMAPRLAPTQNGIKKAL